MLGAAPCGLGKACSAFYLESFTYLRRTFGCNPRSRDACAKGAALDRPAATAQRAPECMQVVDRQLR